LSKQIIDSYTKEPLADEYVSQIPGINRPRSLYREELTRRTAQYAVSPAAEEWKLVREGCPESLFPRFQSENVAAQVMDWLVLNDASVAIAIHWLAKGDVDPFFRLLDDITKVAERATVPDTVCPRQSGSRCYYPGCLCPIAYMPADGRTVNADLSV
jgi:hypothetical protein